MLTQSLFQVIITGVSVSQESAKKIRDYCVANNIFAIDWCHPDGTIGYIDGSSKILTPAKLKKELASLAKEFPFLHLGVTLMNGVPGGYNMPLAQFVVEKAHVVSTNISPHFSHPPPRRLKVT